MERQAGAAAESSGHTRANVNVNRAHALTIANTSGGTAHRCGSGTHRQMGGIADHLLAAR